MAFDAISTAELSVGKPITNELMEKFRNRDEDLNGRVGTLSALSISNPSFEISDTAAAGGAANWTFTALTGGNGTIDTSTSAGGGQSVVITHPGGAGNGGGYYESDFYEVSLNAGYLIEYEQSVKGGAVPRVDVIRYDRNQSTIDEVFLIGSTVVDTTGRFYRKSFGFLASSAQSTVTGLPVNSSVTYIKLRLTGGTTDHSTAGTINFDNVQVIEQPFSSVGGHAIAYTNNIEAENATATTSFQYTVTIGHAGGYRFWFEVAPTTVSSATIYVNGTALQSYTLSPGVVINFSLPNATNTQYLKAGDVISYRTNLGGGLLYGAARVGVKNPTHGQAGILYGTVTT